MIQKPYNINIRGLTLDASEQNEIFWNTSGDLQTSFEIDFLNNEDNTNVHSTGIIESYSPSFNLSGGILLNGQEYKIVITIYNSDGDSAKSEPEVFKTSSRPIVSIDNMGTVNSFSYNFTGSYSQNEDIPLRSYIFILYDKDKNLINKSNIKTIAPIEHLFSDLDTDESYFVELQATSNDGLTGTSGLVFFDVFYFRPKMNVNISHKDVEGGGIELSWYVTQIIGETDSATFIDNEKIDTRNNRPVYFEDGLTIDEDFTLKVWIESPYVSNISEKVDLLTLYGDNGTIHLQYYGDNKFHLWKVVNGVESHWSSERVVGSKFFVSIQQINKDMNIYSEVIL